MWYSSATGYGELVAVVAHDLGSPGYNFTNAYGEVIRTSKVLSIYGHIRKSQQRGGTPLNWRVGSEVNKGDILGYINDGAHNGDGGEHLHMGIKLSDAATAQQRDPGYWFRGYEQATEFGVDFTSALEVISLLKDKDKLLARSEGHDEAYWLQNGMAYHVLTSDIIEKMSSLPNWGLNQIHVYSPGVILVAPPGIPVLSGGGVFYQGPDFIAGDRGSDGILMRREGLDRVYVIENGRTRWITSLEVFNQWGYDPNDIIMVTGEISFIFECGPYIADGTLPADLNYDGYVNAVTLAFYCLIGSQPIDLQRI